MKQTTDFYFSLTFYYDSQTKKYTCDTILYLKKNLQSGMLSSLFINPSVNAYGQNLIPEWGVDLGGEYRQKTQSFVSTSQTAIEQLVFEKIGALTLTLKDVVDKNKLHYCIFTRQTLEVKVEVL